VGFVLLTVISFEMPLKAISVISKCGEKRRNAKKGGKFKREA